MQGTPKPSDFWAKLKYRDDDRSTGEIIAWNPLMAHSADVAAVTEALLTRTILRDRMAALMGWSDLSDVHVARLAALAAIHDAGKANHGFQNRSDPSAPPIGHVQPMVDVLSADAPLPYLLPLGIEEMFPWFGDDDNLIHFLLATWGHHGRPVRNSAGFKRDLWEASGTRDPMAAFEQLAGYIKTWFPEAFTEAQPFPSAPIVQHAFNGVLTLADWIGSDSERFFPFAASEDDPMPRARENGARAVETLFLDASTARNALGSSEVDFTPVLDEPEWDPYPIQQACYDLPLYDNGSLTILESDTGSGKTEAAVARFLRLYQHGLVDAMYFAVPTRTAATQLHGRVSDIMARAFPEEETRPPVVQAVPGYIKVDDVEAMRLPGFEVRWDEDRDMTFRGWAAQGPKRYLAGPVVVGTIDQVLLSTLQVRHAHMRAAALLRHLLVIDEVHASDVYMTELTDRVLDLHLKAGGHAFLMSATLGSAARSRLSSQGHISAPDPEEAEQVAYPLVTHVDGRRREPVSKHATSVDTQKTVVPETTSLADDPAAIAATAVQHARNGARVLIIRNRVADCVATQRALEDAVGDDHELLFQIDGVPAAHHSRFAPDDRRLLDDTIEDLFGKATTRSSVVAAATQTVEQSLDIDADLLITDLCPMDVLLQRIGRLHRHSRTRPVGYEKARCLVLTPEDRDLGQHIRGEGFAPGPHGLGTVYQDLRMVEATWRVLEDPSLPEWQIPKDNRVLVERGTHPQLLHELVDTLGEAWQTHARYILGKKLAEQQHPRLVGIPLHKPFAEEEFARDLGQVKTRLGGDDYRAELPKATPGPFGPLIKEVNIPDWQFHTPPDEDETAKNVSPFDGGFAFDFGGHTFKYNRLGLTKQS